MTLYQQENQLKELHISKAEMRDVVHKTANTLMTKKSLLKKTHMTSGIVCVCQKVFRKFK